MSAVRRSGAAMVVLLGLLTSSCGVPGEGPVERVEDDEVPYRLLEPTDPTGPSSEDPAPGPAPSAFWLREDRLVPGMAVGSCDDEPDDVVEQVLDVLADGPQDDERVGGRSTAIPPESSLALVGLDDSTAEVEFSAPTAISADRLPVAVGQIALAVGSAPGVGSVQLVDDGEPVPVPLPGGALTTAPVTADDYGSLLSARVPLTAAAGCPGD